MLSTGSFLCSSIHRKTHLRKCLLDYSRLCPSMVLVTPCQHIPKHLNGSRPILHGSRGQFFFPEEVFFPLQNHDLQVYFNYLLGWLYHFFHTNCTLFHRINWFLILKKTYSLCGSRPIKVIIFMEIACVRKELISGLHIIYGVLSASSISSLNCALPTQSAVHSLIFL